MLLLLEGFQLEDKNINMVSLVMCLVFLGVLVKVM